jgi:predicted RNase H-like nuclease (RuvC/YqgF family)
MCLLLFNRRKGEMTKIQTFIDEMKRENKILKEIIKTYEQIYYLHKQEINDLDKNAQEHTRKMGELI